MLQEWELQQLPASASTVSMTDIPFGIDKSPGNDKYGYPRGALRSLDDIEYVVYHSLEGWRSNVMNILTGPRRASWLGTILLDGTLWRHYEIEAPTWTTSTKENNIKGAAFEFEGVNDNAPPTTFNIGRGSITDAQVTTAARIFEFLQENCPNLGDPQLPYGFQEHRILTNYATQCPSGRIRWQAIADLLKEEDMVVFIQPKGKPEVFELTYPLQHIDNQESLGAYKKALDDVGVQHKLVELPANHPVFSKIDRYMRPD